MRATRTTTKSRRNEWGGGEEEAEKEAEEEDVHRHTLLLLLINVSQGSVPLSNRLTMTLKRSHPQNDRIKPSFQ
jgi:hypothetical protein